MKIAVLGCGTMARAIVVPMKTFDPDLEVWTYTPSRTRAAALAADTEGRVLDEPGDLSPFDLIFLGCKPQQFADLCQRAGGRTRDRRPSPSWRAFPPPPSDAGSV